MLRDRFLRQIIDGLKYAVAKSIRKTIEECPANGWVRSDQIDDFQSKTIEQLQDMLLMMKNTQMERKHSSSMDISIEAKTLLREGCKTLSGTSVSTGDKVFCNEATSRLEAVWLGAIDELIQNGYIYDPTGKQEIYCVTR